MAVFTPVSFSQAKALCDNFDKINTLKTISPIIEGIENSNFILVDSDNNKYILTLFEKRVSASDIPYFVSLMNFLYKLELPVPQVIDDKYNNTLHSLSGRTCILTSFLEGSQITKPKDYHLQEIGSFLANMHLASNKFKYHRENSLSLPQWTKILTSVMSEVNSIEPYLDKLLESSLQKISRVWQNDELSALPSGICHNDLFTDNVFFQSKTISGVFDFYFASHENFIYDITVTIHAWCFPDHESLDVSLVQNLLKSYQKIRPITQKEWELMPIIMIASSLRFVSTRLYDWFNPPPTENYRPKDPNEYLSHLKWCLANESFWSDNKELFSP